MSDRLTVFSSRNPQGTLGDSVVEIQKKKFAADAAKKCAPDGSCGGTQFMNCSWIIQLLHEHVHEHVQIFVANIWIFPNS
jgi:hypothetical protein